MAAQSMTPTQKHLFKLLVEIDDICKRHDIEYFLDAGTVLGVVRHGGFLPWDDDLDIVMTEPNYDKFVAACQAELNPETRMYCDNRLNREFPTVFGHYIDTTTCRLSDRTPFWDYHCGQSIDVFCLVELPSDPTERDRIANLYFAYDEYVNQSFNHYKRKTEEINRIYEGLYAREHEIGRDAVLAECEQQIFGHHYDDCDTLMLTSAHMHWNTLLPKYIYDNSRLVDWNGLTVRIPGDWYALMAIDYGDNFYEIPREVRVHSQMSFTGLPAKAYVDDFMKSTNKEQLLATRLEAKQYAFKEGLWLNRINTPLFKALGVQMSKELDDRLAAEGADLMGLVNENTLEADQKLERLLGDYLDKQTDTSVLYWRINLGHSDAADVAILKVLLMRGNVQKMIRLLRVRQINGLAVTTDMQRLMDAGMHLRTMKKHWYYDELGEGAKEEAWVWNNLPHTGEVRVWHAMYDFYGRHAANDAKAPTLEACTEQARELFGHVKKANDLAAKTLADALSEAGNADESLALMLWIKDYSNNGFVLNAVAPVLEAASEDELTAAQDILDTTYAFAKPSKKKKAPIKPRFKNIQAKTLALAKEVDDACKELGIPYACCTTEVGWTKKRKGFYGTQYGIHVMMRAPHALKLKAKLEAAGRTDRIFEDLSTNPELPFNRIRYVDTTTTVLDMTEDNDGHLPYRALGAVLTIHPLYTQASNAIERRIEWGHQLLKAGREYGNKPLTKKKAAALKQVKALEGCLGSKLVAKHLYKRLGKEGSGNKLYTYDAPAGLVAIDADMIDKAKYAPFKSIELPFPHKQNEYLECWLGREWAKVDQSNFMPARANRIKCISSDSMGYAETLALFKKGGVDYEDIQKTAREFFHWSCKELAPRDYAQRTDYARARMSRDRIDIYLRLKPQMETLRAAAKAKDVETIRAILDEQEYCQRAERFFNNYKLGLFINDEILKFAGLVWEADDKPNMVNNVRECAPTHYLTCNLEEYLANYQQG